MQEDNILFFFFQPIAMVRNSWKSRGPLFTEFGVSIRCVTTDQTGNTNVLHYLNDGTCTFSFIHNKEQFFVPIALVLKVSFLLVFEKTSNLKIIFNKIG